MQVPELSFDLNLGSLFSPAVMLALGYLVHQARKGITRHFDARHDAVEAQVAERHKETTEHLTNIEGKQDKTNGRLLTVEEKVQSDHDKLLKLEGSVETLMTLRKGETQ